MTEAAFDRDFSLAELIRGVDVARLLAELSTLAGTTLALTDLKGQPVAGTAPGAGAARAPVITELEPVAYVTGMAEDGPLRAAARAVAVTLRTNSRYLMASDLHMETVHADYEALQEKHRALQASEARYRKLAGELERRVQAQVKTIETAQRQLYHSERLASVGQLAAGVAHEINNPMGFIRSNLRTATGYVATLSKVLKACRAGSTPAEVEAVVQEHDVDYLLEDFAELLVESSDGADRVARIVADLKGFSQVDQGGVEAIDLNGLINKVVNVARPQFASGVHLNFDAGELPQVPCRAGHISQAIYAVLLNAAEAAAPRGRVAIRTTRRGDCAVIDIADDGPGIPEAIRSRIFDPFFSTREVGAGTGLGLTVARDTVTGDGGRITFDSAPDETVFHIELPLRAGGREAADG